MVAYKNIKFRHLLFVIMTVLAILMITSSCSLFGGGESKPVVAPRIDEKSPPRLQRILPDYINEDGEEDFYSDEDAYMPVKNGENLYLILDYNNKDNLSINKVILSGGGKEFEVVSREFKEESNSNRTIIEITVDADPGLLTYTVKRILYNARSNVLDMRLTDNQSLLSFVVNVDPVFNVTLDYQNTDPRPGAVQPGVTKEVKKVPFGTPLEQLIPALNVAIGDTVIPEKAGGWTYRGYFVHPNGLGTQVRPLGKFYFWKDIVLYAHYERLYNFKVTNATVPIPYEENGQSKEYKKVATITKKTGAGDEQRILEIYDTIADENDVYPIVYIDSAAFDNTATLTTLKIGKYLKEIGANAFFNSKVIDVEFHPDGMLEKIGDQAFMGSSRLGTGLKGFTLPRTVKYLGDRCFEKTGWGKMIAEGEQSAKSTLVIYDNLTHIGNWCFRETNFTEVVFDAGVQFKADAVQGQNYQIGVNNQDDPIYADSDYYLGWCLFKDCDTLKRFRTRSDDGQDNGLEIIPDGMFDIIYYSNKSDIGLINVILAEGLKKIGKGAFHYQKLLESITLPATLEDIGGDNTGKSKQYFGSTKERSEYGAFHECQKLSNIEFVGESQLKIIGMDAFYNNRELKSIVISSKVLEEYGDGPFRGCNDLTNVTFNFDNPDNVPQPMSNGRALLGGTKDADFFYANLQFKVFVEDVVVDKFRISLGKGASGSMKGNLPIYGLSMIKDLLNKKGEIVAQIALEETRSIMDDSIGWRLGYYFGEEENVYLPNEFDGKRIVAIGPAAFNKGLEKIRLPQYVAWIEPHAFDSCTSLTQIIFGDIITGSKQSGMDQLKRIGEQAFYKTAITYFKGGNQLSEIGKHAFWSCTSLVWVDLKGTQLTGENEQPISEGAFWQCSNLKYIRFPIGFRKMATSTLADCRGLEDIVFENPSPSGSMFAEEAGAYFSRVPLSVNICVPEDAVSMYQNLDNFPRNLIIRVIPHYPTGIEPEQFGFTMPGTEIIWWSIEEWNY